TPPNSLTLGARSLAPGLLVFPGLVVLIARRYDPSPLPDSRQLSACTILPGHRDRYRSRTTGKVRPLRRTARRLARLVLKPGAESTGTLQRAQALPALPPRQEARKPLSPSSSKTACVWRSTAGSGCRRQASRSPQAGG